MPYIKPEGRVFLDGCVYRMMECLTEGNELTDEEFMAIIGEVNYVFSRVITGCMGKPSYAKICMITGVLENIKQEFYRRVATPYEMDKMVQNGDIKEYRRLFP